MGASMVTVGIIVAKYRHDWPNHVAAGWSAVGKPTYLILKFDLH
jgi:hypothetical protein